MSDLALNTTTDEYIWGRKVEPIEDSYDKNEEYRSVVQRYFTIRYVLNIGCLMGDYNVMFHSNRICVITLAPTHFLIATNQTIVKTEFEVMGYNRLFNVVLGKSKKGAQEVEVDDSFLFYVGCADGSFIGLCGCVPGKIIEVNRALVDDPNLMTRDPWGKGYLAVVQPTIYNYEHYKKKYLTAKQFLEQKRVHSTLQTVHPLLD